MASLEQIEDRLGEKRKQVVSKTSPNKLANSKGKENQDHQQERFCFECNRPLSKSRHLINIAGQAHKWHPECFKCNVCKQPMDKETSCHVYKDKIVCREDYAKLLRDKSTKCSRCGWLIASSDWVRKAGQYVYHLTCFSCDICLRQLSTGEQFTISVQQEKGFQIRLLCRLHFAVEPPTQAASKTFQSNNFEGSSTNNVLDDRSSSSPARALDSAYEYSLNNRSSIVAANQQCQKYYQNQDQYLHMLAATSNHHSMMVDQRVKSNSAPFNDDLMHQMSDEIGANHLMSGSQRIGGASTSSSNGSTSGIMGLPSKSKRVRTTFTEDQLSILQTHFQIDSNPDGQDLERIATITGLSKRVTQVWFQNSRARQKKYMIKRKPSSCTLSNANGTPNSSTAQTSLNSAIGLTSECGSQNRECSQSYQLGVGNSNRNGEAAERQQRWSNLSPEVSLDGTNQNAMLLEDTEDEETRTSNSTDNDDNHLVITDDEEADFEDEQRATCEDEEDSAS